MQIRPADPIVHPDFFGIVEAIDLSLPIGPEDVAAIEAGMARFAVLAFRDQHLTDEQQVAFTRHFGPLEGTLDGHIAKAEERRLQSEIADISNLDQNNKLLARDDRRRMFNLGNMLWHSDSSFKPTPAKYSLLSARVVPAAGGNTEFADMRAAYDALDAATGRQVQDLVCEHSLMYSRGQLGFSEFTDEERRKFVPVPQRLVRRHPVSGRRSLFLASHAGGIQGWPMPEARAFLRDLIEHATRPRFVHIHRWRPFDLVMWDNRVTMHRARRYDENAEVRDLRRTTVQDAGPTLEQAA